MTTSIIATPRFISPSYSLAIATPISSNVMFHYDQIMSVLDSLIETLHSFGGNFKCCKTCGIKIHASTGVSGMTRLKITSGAMSGGTQVGVIICEEEKVNGEFVSTITITEMNEIRTEKSFYQRAVEAHGNTTLIARFFADHDKTPNAYIADFFWLYSTVLHSLRVAALKDNSRSMYKIVAGELADYSFFDVDSSHDVVSQNIKAIIVRAA